MLHAQLKHVLFCNHFLKNSLRPFSSITTCRIISSNLTNYNGGFKNKKLFWNENLCFLQVRGKTDKNHKIDLGIEVNEISPRGIYELEDELSSTESIKLGLSLLKFEVAKWKHETKEKLLQDPLIVLPGDRDKVWSFDGHRKSPSGGLYCNPSDYATSINPTTSLNHKHIVETSGSCFDGWTVASDAKHMEGFSKVEFKASPAGHAYFTGVLDTTLPEDGLVSYAGYCSMRCIRPTRSFARRHFFDWSAYTHLVIRCRGDGRSYVLHLNNSGEFDLTWNNGYTYILYTRGGPHWQTYKVPFSKFLFTHKGSVQDRQHALSQWRITNFGISLGDKINGPFQLEIDYIALENDPIHTEVSAYELYYHPHLM